MLCLSGQKGISKSVLFFNKTNERKNSEYLKYKYQVLVICKGVGGAHQIFYIYCNLTLWMVSIGLKYSGWTVHM